MISYQTYHRVSKYGILSLLTSLLLSPGTSRAVLGHVESTIKTEFSRTNKGVFVTSGMSTGILMVLKSVFAFCFGHPLRLLTLRFSRNSEYMLSSERFKT